MESGIEEEGWEIVEDYPSLEHEEGGQKSRLGWVMDAGKKVVITGLVVSSIPLFLPPLVVISALGLAFSVPYGVVFASYACTQKLMTKLLLPPSPEAEEDIKEMQDNQIMREGCHNLEEKEPYFDGIIKDDMNEGENLLPEKIITETETDVKNGEETEHLPQGNNEKIITETETGVKNEEETEHLPQDKNEKIFTETETGVKNEEETEHLPQDKNEKIFTETETGVKNEEETEHLPQDKNEKIFTETETGVKNEEETEHLPQDKNEKIVTEANKDKGHEERVLEKHETKKDEGEKMKKETGKRRKKKKDWGKRKEAEGENLESGKVIAVEEGSTNDVPAENFEVTTVVIQDDSSVTVFETTAIIAEGKGKELKEDKEENAEVKVIKVKQGKDIAGLHSEDQEAFRDEKIWEKIDAIRGITGFKAPRRDSYYEELKALYLFTGIEAPATSSDTPAADFVEFYSKLCFLMSVIGAK